MTVAHYSMDGMPNRTGLRVLHRINLNVAGGVENQFRAFIEHPRVCEQMGNRVLIGEPVHPDLEDGIHRHAEEVQSFKRWRGIKLPRQPASIRNWRTGRIIGAPRPDALLSWSAFAKPALAAGCERHGVPLIYREGGAAWGSADGANARRFLDQVAGAICNTHASRRMLQLKWGFSGSTRICLGGIRGNALSPAPRPRDIGDTVVLGCAARLVPIKGVAVAIHALEQLVRTGVQAELRIAGDGPERSRLVQLAQSLGVADRVHFLGAVSDMRAFYEAVDVFLHAALREPLGNVCIEAAANGCVAIAARVDGLAETVEHGLTGITLSPNLELSDYEALGGHPTDMPALVYDPDEDRLRELRCVGPDALAGAVTDMVEDPERFHRMSADAIERTRARFSFERYVDEVIDAIRAFGDLDGNSG